MKKYPKLFFSLCLALCIALTACASYEPVADVSSPPQGNEASSKSDTEPDSSLQEMTEGQELDLENTVKLAYVGDLVLLQKQIAAAYDEETDSYNFDEMFEYAAPYLQDADLAISDLEGPMAGGPDYTASNYNDGIKLCMNFPDEFAVAIKKSGIDFVTTANNHLLDMGVDGAMRTLDVLDEVGLDHIGSYRNQAEKDTLKIIEVGGVKIAFLAYVQSINDHSASDVAGDLPYITSIQPRDSNKHYDRLMVEIAEDFAQAKASDADLIIVLPHMGGQFKTEPKEIQKKYNQLFADLGADVILGCHAHIVQPIEQIDDTLVVNCPGKFCESYIKHDGDAATIIEVYIDKDTKKVVASSVIPMYIHDIEKGHFQAIPIYDIMSNAELYGKMSKKALSRLEEIYPFITGTMFDVEIPLSDYKERLYLVNGEYYAPEN